MINVVERTISEVFESGITFPRVHVVSFLRGYDLYEKDDTLFVEVNVSGFSKKDISVDSEDGTLHIIADSGDDDNYGFRSHTINKNLKLPVNADTEAISAKVKDGLLTISIPLQIKKHKIKIK